MDVCVLSCDYSPVTRHLLTNFTTHAAVCDGKFGHSIGGMDHAECYCDNVEHTERNSKGLIEDMLLQVSYLVRTHLCQEACNAYILAPHVLLA